MDGWIRLIVGFQSLMVISPTANCWCVCTGPILYFMRAASTWRSLGIRSCQTFCSDLAWMLSHGAVLGLMTWIDVAVIITCFGTVWPFWCWCAIKLWYHHHHNRPAASLSCDNRHTPCTCTVRGFIMHVCGNNISACGNATAWHHPLPVLSLECAQLGSSNLLTDMNPSEMVAECEMVPKTCQTVLILTSHSKNDDEVGWCCIMGEWESCTYC